MTKDDTTAGPILDRAASAELDRRAIALGVPSLVLMENAAIGLARFIADAAKPGARVVIACGPGNNGGDGIACARLLHTIGITTHVWLVAPADRLRGDAVPQHDIARSLGIPFDGSDHIAEADVIVDALFGTGLTRPIEGALADAVASINSARDAGARVIAADIPSGIDVDTGKAFGSLDSPAVRADATVTFAALKPGLLQAPGSTFAGRVSVVPIGVPTSLVADLAASPR
ncbi:MAG: NAD(P)H-hydrate epimerase [Planctomycetota bacterium]